MERKSKRTNQISNQFNSSINLDDFELLQFDLLDEKEKEMNKKSNENNHKDEYRNNNSTYMSSNYLYSTSTLPYNSSNQIISQIGFFHDNLKNPLNSTNTLNTMREKFESSNNLNSSNYINGLVNNNTYPEFNHYNYKSSNYMFNINTNNHPYSNTYLYNYPNYNYQVNYPTDIPIFNINNNINPNHQSYNLKSHFESHSTSNINNITKSTSKKYKQIADKSNSNKTEAKFCEFTQITSVSKEEINDNKDIDNKLKRKKTEENSFDNNSYEYQNICREQNGSRLLQKKLDEKDGLADSLINNKNIRSSIIEMSNHQFGNYFIQKLIEKLNKLENIEYITDQVSK